MNTKSREFSFGHCVHDLHTAVRQVSTTKYLGMMGRTGCRVNFKSAFFELKARDPFEKVFQFRLPSRDDDQIGIQGESFFCDFESSLRGDLGFIEQHGKARTYFRKSSREGVKPK